MLKEMLDRKLEDMPDEESTSPTISLSEEHLPESKDWKDGEDYSLVMNVKQVSPGQFSVESVSAIDPEEADKDMEEEGTGEKEGNDNEELE